MTDRDIMQQALEALNRSDYLGWQVNIPIIKALRERLAQPEQELVCVCGAIWEGQELVSTPPQRTWVGLTEEDFSAINQSCLTKLQAATSAESILKDKNNG